MCIVYTGRYVYTIPGPGLHLFTCRQQAYTCKGENQIRYLFDIQKLHPYDLYHFFFYVYHNTLKVHVGRHHGNSTVAVQ